MVAMDAETLAHWRAADALFDRWLDLPEGEREAWLAAQDPAAPVRHRFDQLVSAHRNPRIAPAASGDTLAGTRLGQWLLDAELGRGGMAVVYRGWREQGMARQQAAIKILTLGALGSTGRERFQREAAILARLNHPNVTALVDSGVADDGTCWLAMPLVDGERIDRWCEANAPDARAIVRLYLQVCDAVAYAHRNLVIHRDLKPSNVLIEAGGHVRLLDFGIGQFTDSVDERTQTMWRAMTPGYAAPEQLRGAPPSTAIDVYGLGALLHRLLTGRTPQATTEGSESTRPSLLVRATDDAYHRHYVPLKNDLDRVLLKALAEEPEHRYPTAEALADDLRRWLDGRPVLAQKPKPGYRVRKFIVRNKVGVAAAVLLVATLGGGIGATLWQADAARREAENARIQAQRAVLVRDFLQRVFASTEPASGGVPTALELLDEGARRARSEVLDTDPLAAADILMLTGDARSSLSEYAAAQTDLQTALALLVRHAPDALHDRMQVHLGLSALSRITGDSDAALKQARTAIDLGQRFDAPPDDRLRARKAVAEALAFTEPENAETQLRAILDEIPANGLARTRLHAEVLSVLTGAMLQANRDRGQVLQLLEEELQLWREIHGEDSGVYAHMLASIGGVFLASGQSPRAGEMIRQAAAIADRTYEKPQHTTAVINCHLGAWFHAEGRFDEAASSYSRALDIDAATGRQNLQSSECSRYRAIARAALGQHDGALQDLDRSQSLRQLNQVLDSRTTKGICGLRASIHLRQRDVLAATRALDGCPVTEQVGTSFWYSMAQVELELARGNPGKAKELVATIRKQPQNAPGGLDRSWMRPWMLSLLLAHDMGDATTKATLVAELGDFAQQAPLSQCLAAPDKTNCLVLL
jgi:serine/threonine-protein kinase